MTDPVVLFFAALVGLALGSFLNVCVVRWPRGGSVVRPRSACPACSAPVRWYDQIPVASWFVLRGRCRTCHARISPCYPLVEGAAAAVCVLVVFTRGVSVEGAADVVFLLILLGIALTDARFYLIPDRFSLGGAAAGLAVAFAPGGIGPGSAAAGAVAGFGGMWLVGVAGTWLLVRARPGRLEAAARQHDRGRRRTRDAATVRALERPRAQVAVLLPAGPAVMLAGWGFGPAGAAAAMAAYAAGLAVLVAWVEGLGEEAGAEPLAGGAPVAAAPSPPSAARAPRAVSAREDDSTRPGDSPGAPVTPDAVLGGGDVKMMALVGAFTGPWGVVLTVFLGALAGVLAYLKLRLLTGTRQLLPLGVFLAVGGAVTVWWGDALLDWYLRLTGLPSPS